MTAGWTFFRSSGFPFLTVAMLCSAQCQQDALRFRSSSRFRACGFGMMWCDCCSSSVLAVLENLLIAHRVRIYVHHVTDTTGGQPVQTGTDTLDGDDVQVSCAGVVCAVHDGTAAVLSVSRLCPRLVRESYEFRWIASRCLQGRSNVHWETQGHLELATGGTTAAKRPPSVKLFLECPNSSCPMVFHLFRSSIQAVCGRLAASSSGCRVCLPCVVEFLSVRRWFRVVLRLCPIDRNSLGPQQLGLTPMVDLRQVLVRTHEILAILSY